MTSDPVSTPQNMLHLQRHLHLAMSVIWWFDFQTSFSPGVTCCDMLKCMARIGRYALTGHHTWFVVFRSWFPVLGIVHVSYIFFQKSITPLPVSIDTDPGGGAWIEKWRARCAQLAFQTPTHKVTNSPQMVPWKATRPSKSLQTHPLKRPFCKNFQFQNRTP
jgi:hypothetical protein